MGGRTRDDDLSTQDGYFLAGRSLTGPVIAGSLMLTNLSTEQLIGQTGQSFSTNMGPIAWEVTSAAALVILALVFLPRYLKMGLTTVPEFLENRYDSTTKRIVSIMFLLGYLLTYLPTVLYSGALVFNQIFEVDKRMGVSQMQGVIITAVAIGIVGRLLRHLRRPEGGCGIGYHQRHRTDHRRLYDPDLRSADARQ